MHEAHLIRTCLCFLFILVHLLWLLFHKENQFMSVCQPCQQMQNYARFTNKGGSSYIAFHQGMAEDYPSLPYYTVHTYWVEKLL